jgi:hypothetical protein
MIGSITVIRENAADHLSAGGARGGKRALDLLEQVVLYESLQPSVISEKLSFFVVPARAWVLLNRFKHSTQEG